MMPEPQTDLRMIIFAVQTLDASKGGRRKQVIYSGEHLSPAQVIRIARENASEKTPYFQEWAIAGGENVILSIVKFNPEGEGRSVWDANDIHIPNTEETRRAINWAFYGESPSQWTTIEGCFRNQPEERGLVLSEILLKDHIIHQEVAGLVNSQPEEFRNNLYGYRATDFYVDGREAVFSQHNVRELFEPDYTWRRLDKCKVYGGDTVRLSLASMIAKPQGEFLKFIPSERK